MNDMHSADYWNARYAGEVYRFGEAPNAFLVRETARLAPGSRILAVADGEGRNSVWLARNGMTVHALDVSSVALEKARLLAERNRVDVQFEEADLGVWEGPTAAYDAVVAIFIQFAGPDLRARLFEMMKRTLKPGGLLLVEGYRPEQLAFGTGGPPVVENMYDETLLRAAFSDFEIVSIESYDAELSEGPGHHGMSAVIDLVARKPA